MSKRTEKAAEVYATNCNCAQSALCAFEDLTGLEEGTALRVASPLGGGIGGMGRICGALSGVILAAGMIKGYGFDPTPEEKKSFNAYVRALVEAFEARFGSSDCTPLLEQNEKDGLSKKGCNRYVVGAVELLEERL